MNKFDIETPALLLDCDALERNIAKMAEYFRDKKSKVRPHIKTHKTPIIAHKQIEAGAIGITCAKLSEAEVMVTAGIKDILIANQIVGRNKIERLVNLNKHSNVKVAVDDLGNARNLSQEAHRKGVKVGVVIEVNVGMNRCGVDPGKPALALARELIKCDGLDFKGLMGYEGHIISVPSFEKRKEECKKAMALLVETKDLLEDNGIAVEIVSAGGTGTYNIAGEYPGITEIQAGSYATMDTKYAGLEGIGDFESSLTVLGTVISKQTNDRAVVDVSRKSLSYDQGIPQVKHIKGVEVLKLVDEHGYLRLNTPDRDIAVGDKLELSVTHGCTTIMLHDRFHVVRDDELEAVWRIEARGKFQ